jgi:hypothetical protein
MGAQLRLLGVVRCALPTCAPHALDSNPRTEERTPSTPRCLWPTRACRQPPDMHQVANVSLRVRFEKDLLERPSGEAFWRPKGLAMRTEAGTAVSRPQEGSSSVAQQYLHALVFSTSSMDSLVPQQIELADRLIAHFLPAFIVFAGLPSREPILGRRTRGSAPARLAQSTAARQDPACASCRRGRRSPDSKN